MNDYNQLKFGFWDDVNFMTFRTKFEYLVGIESTKDFDYYFVNLICGEHDI